MTFRKGIHVCGPYKYFFDRNENVVIEKFMADEQYVRVSRRIDGRRVVAIGNYAFAGCISIKKITLPDTVTDIGDYAFCLCSSLEKIVLPNSVTSIGMRAFDGCVCLKEIHLPDSLSFLGGMAFNNCLSLENVEEAFRQSGFSFNAYYEQSKPKKTVIPEKKDICRKKVEKIIKPYETDVLGDTLKKIIELKGMEVCSNTALIFSMMSDLAPKLKAERLQLKWVFDSGVWMNLLRSADGTPKDQKKIVKRSITALQDLGIQEHISKTLVLNIAAAFQYHEFILEENAR